MVRYSGIRISRIASLTRLIEILNRNKNTIRKFYVFYNILPLLFFKHIQLSLSSKFFSSLLYAIFMIVGALCRVSEAPDFRRLRLRLLVYCKAENYEFVKTKKKIFSSMIKNYKVEHVNSVICMGEENIFFCCYEVIVFWLTIHQKPKPKLRNFFGSGSGSSQKGQLRLRNSGFMINSCGWPNLQPFWEIPCTRPELYWKEGKVNLKVQHVQILTPAAYSWRLCKRPVLIFEHDVVVGKQSTWETNNTMKTWQALL